MNRVVRDHMGSGYLAKVEYRAVKESDQEIDYIIRYYPGLGATASMDRIQIHMQHGRASRRHLAQVRSGNPTTEPSTHEQSEKPLGLSVVTSDHVNLISELVLKFGVNRNKAYHLVMTRPETVKFQIEVWPLRRVVPRNRAGWMIQAIENNYEPPSSYLNQKEEEEKQRDIALGRATVQQCDFCDDNGFRYLKTKQYPNGAMRLCSHDPSVESKHTQGGDSSPNAEIGSVGAYRD
jgi:hypothetical protein